MNLSRTEVGTAILGTFDGVTCLLGLLAALIIGNAGHHAVLLAVVGLAVAETISMAGGEYLGDGEKQGQVRRAGIMGLSVLLGAVLPALPYLLIPGRPGLVASLVVVVLLGAVIAHLRHDRAGALAYAQTYAILGLGGALSVGASLLLGVA